MPPSSHIPNSTAATEDFEFAALQEAYHYPRSIVREFQPFLQGNVMEVGAGIGQMTRLFADCHGAERITAVEPDPGFAQKFREECPHLRLLEGTISEVSLPENYDTIVSVNVIEHIEDHADEIKRYHDILSPRQGSLCILAPARSELYSPIDKDFGHFRRYTKSSMGKCLQDAGFKIERLYYFNFAGYFAWLLNFKIMRSRSFNPTAVHLYDQSVYRVTNFFETKLTRPMVGQSIIAIAKAV
jgi:SAM-dependent methyltransferase